MITNIIINTFVFNENNRLAAAVYFKYFVSFSLTPKQIIYFSLPRAEA